MRRQQPGEGRSTSDGPGPPGTILRTGGPATRAPSIGTARTQSAARELGRLETQRILLLLSAAGGERSGWANRTAAISPDLPTACGIRGLGAENPARAQAGRTPVRTCGRHGLGGDSDPPAGAAAESSETERAAATSQRIRTERYPGQAHARRRPRGRPGREVVGCAWGDNIRAISPDAVPSRHPVPGRAEPRPPDGCTLG